MATLDDDTMDVIVGKKSAHDAWSAILEQFSTDSRANIMQLKTDLQTIKKGADTIGIHDVATVRENNVQPGRVLRIRDEDSTFIDVDPNEETDDDSDDELRHRLPDINSDTEEDSSDDSY
ncbi:hypothetical protein ACLB2K_066602 [Fragaria x ananassa]